jgi:GNAT superfamily N-acetyltransferase
MWWRLTRADYNRRKGEQNRKAFQRIVKGGEVPGLLAYLGRTPVGWCSVGPRERFPALDRSRVLARVDGEPVWSIVCFFIAREYRRRGMTLRLIGAAADFARRRGARLLEAYPVQGAGPGRKTADAFAYTGFDSAFRAAGFTEAVRRSPHRAVYRLPLSRPQE